MLSGKISQFLNCIFIKIRENSEERPIYSVSGWSFQSNDKHPKLKPVTVNTCDGNNANGDRDVTPAEVSIDHHFSISAN